LSYTGPPCRLGIDSWAPLKVYKFGLDGLLVECRIVPFTEEKRNCTLVFDLEFRIRILFFSSVALKMPTKKLVFFFLTFLGSLLTAGILYQASKKHVIKNLQN
jgi:hypothetical protein